MANLWESYRARLAPPAAPAASSGGNLWESYRLRQEEERRRREAGRAQSDAVVAGLQDAPDSVLGAAGRALSDAWRGTLQTVAEGRQQAAGGLGAALRGVGEAAAEAPPGPFSGPVRALGGALAAGGGELERLARPYEVAQNRDAVAALRRSPVSSAALDVAATAPQLLEQAAIASTPLGIPGALGVIGAQSGGQALQQAERAGASQGQALAAGAGAAGAEVVLSQIAEVPLLKRLLGKAARPETVRQALKVIGRQAGLEFTEESLTSAAQRAVDLAAYKGERGESFTSADIRQALYEGGLGAVVGGGAAATTAVPAPRAAAGPELAVAPAPEIAAPAALPPVDQLSEEALAAELRTITRTPDPGGERRKALMAEDVRRRGKPVEPEDRRQPRVDERAAALQAAEEAGDEERARAIERGEFERRGGTLHGPPQQPVDVEDTPLSRLEGRIPVDVVLAKPSQLDLEPRRFQYKENPEPLRFKTWNDSASGMVLAWKDPADGRLKVVNGHRRIGRAKELGLDPDVRVRILQADTAEEARAEGAFINISEGHGTAVDAARFFRGTGLSREDLEARGVSLRERTAGDGFALSKLHDFVFDAVASGGWKVNRGVTIAEVLPDDKSAQLEVAKQVERWEQQGREVTDKAVREVAELAKHGPRGARGDERQGSLFGESEQEQSLLYEKAQILADIRQRLTGEKALFGRVAATTKGSERAVAQLEERGGNVIDRARNEQISAEAAQALELYDRFSSREPIAGLVDEAARRLARGEAKTRVLEDAYAAVRTALPETLRGAEGPASPGADPGGPAQEPAAGEPDVEPGPTQAELEAAGQQGLFGAPPAAAPPTGSGPFDLELSTDHTIAANRYVREGTEEAAKQALATQTPADREALVGALRAQYGNRITVYRAGEIGKGPQSWTTDPEVAARHSRNEEGKAVGAGARAITKGQVYAFDVLFVGAKRDSELVIESSSVTADAPAPAPAPSAKRPRHGIAVPTPPTNTRKSIVGRLQAGGYVKVEDTPENRAMLEGIPGGLDRRLVWTRAAATAPPTDPEELGSLGGNILGTLFRNRRGALIEPRPDDLKAASEDVERRWQAARGLRSPGILSRAREAAVELFRHFRNADSEIDARGGGTEARTANILRLHRASHHAATARAFDAVDDMTVGLTPRQGDIFTRLLVLPDIAKDVEAGLYQGKELPFGYRDVDEVQADLARFEEALERPELAPVKQALAKRQATAREVVAQLVSLDLLPEAVLTDERYYHRQVIAHMDPSRAGGAGGVRINRKGFQRERTGGGDFNTDFQQAEFEWLADAYDLIAKKETLDRLRDTNDIGPGLRRAAKRRNWLTLIGGEEVEARIRELKQVREGLEGEDRRKVTETIWSLDPTMPFKARFAMALDMLKRAGEPINLDEDADEGGGFSRLKALAQSPDEDLRLPALMALKAIAEKNRFIKQTLGTRFVTWQELLPDGYTLWQPERGTQFYPALTITEKALDEVLAGERDLERDDVRETLAMGGPKEQWAIPENVAAVLERIGKAQREEGIVAATTAANTAWKQWVLLNPLRALRYNLNNTSGDLDIALAVSSKILKRAPAAAKQLWAYHISRNAPAASKRYIHDLQQLGVLDSGLTIEEIPDVNREGMLRALYERRPSLLARGVRTYWRGARSFTVWRENVLRLAAYEHFLGEWASGRRPYGASNRTEVDAIADPRERAAKLAREAIGDYGNISQAGQMLRRRAIPFYSWLEVNAPRYVRLFRNAALEGDGRRAAGVAAGAAASVGVRVASTAALSARAHVLYLAIALWNRLVHPEEEDELRRTGNREHSLILGRDESTGEIRSVRFEGALADALEWFGLADWTRDVADVRAGRKGLGTVALEAGKAPVQRIAQGFSPFPKTFIEAATRRSLYPDPLNPRPIYDRGEHLARAVSLDAVYNTAAGKPSREGEGLTAQLVRQALPVYRTDPGESAYWQVRKMVDRFERSRGGAGGGGGFGKSERSLALYYWKRAIRFGDTAAAAKWIARYRELGGSDKGISQSLRMGAPLGELTKADRAAFERSLKPEDQELLRSAVRWYGQTFSPASSSSPGRQE